MINKYTKHNLRIIRCQSQRLSTSLSMFKHCTWVSVVWHLVRINRFLVGLHSDTCQLGIAISELNILFQSSVHLSIISSNRPVWNIQKEGLLLKCFFSIIYLHKSAREALDPMQLLSCRVCTQYCKMSLFIVVVLQRSLTSVRRGTNSKLYR